MNGGRFLCLFVVLFATLVAGAQRPLTLPGQAAPADTLFQRTDSLLPADTALLAADTLRRDTFAFPPLQVLPQRFDTVFYQGHPYFRFTNPVRLREALHVARGKEALFYTLLGLFLMLALARNGFSRYLQDLFRLFFRSTLKQRQAREQLQQSPLPSLLLNLLFFASAALLLYLLFERNGLGRDLGYWPLFGYATAALAALYLGKFIVLRLVGWIFQVPGAADLYIFIIFTANKIIGMLLLPLLALAAFAGTTLAQAALLLSLILVGAVLAYRFFLAYLLVQRQVRLNFFHFFLYVAAFEVAPLLLINKLLFRLLG